MPSFADLIQQGSSHAWLFVPSAILLGALVLGEQLEPRHYAGMALIGVGLAVIDGRSAGLLRPAK